MLHAKVVSKFPPGPYSTPIAPATPACDALLFMYVNNNSHMGHCEYGDTTYKKHIHDNDVHGNVKRLQVLHGCAHISFDPRIWPNHMTFDPLMLILW
jgi:hypothetical protein